MSNWIPKTSNMTISERIRKCREFLSEIKAENDDEDVIYCGTIEYDSQKTEKIRKFFKTVKKETTNEKETKETQKLSKNSKSTEKQQKSAKIRKNAEVKNEKEVSFEINLDEIEGKNNKSNPKIHDCQVILQDISKEIENGKFKNLTVINGEPESDSKSSQMDSIKASSQAECKFCHKKISQHYLSSHLRKFHQVELKHLQIFCEFCDQTFLGMRNLHIHMKKRHPDESKTKIFECDFDGKIFASRVKIQGHMSIHKPKVKCEFCQMMYLPIHLQKHIINVHKNERKFQCNTCQKGFKTPYALKCHEQGHNKRYECKICSRKFTIQKQLRQHVKNAHENPGSFKCDICDKKFSEKKSLKFHQSTHNKNRPKPFKCQRCDFATHLNFTLKNHQKSHEYQEQRIASMKDPVQCEKCLKFFKDMKTLSIHMRHSHSANPRRKTKTETRVECEFCGRKLNKSNIFDHMKRKHPEEIKRFPFSCKFCDERFLTFQKSILHMSSKHPTEFAAINFECDFDGKIFDCREKIRVHMDIHKMKVKCEICQIMLLPKLLRVHMRDVHIEKRIFQCKICQHNFKSYPGLKVHIKSHNKQHECKICLRKFSEQSALKHHQNRYHENPRSFRCKLCSKKFNRKDHLKNHQKSHDKNRPKPFKCQRCDFATHANYNLKKHEIFHEKQDKKFAAMKNPLKCQKCPTFCRNEQALKNHMFHVHPEALFQCDVCGKRLKTKSDIKRHILTRICQKRNL